MTAAELAALITAFGVSLAGIMTALAALMNARNNATKISELEHENARLHEMNEEKTAHNEYQDAVIMDQQRKIEQWAKWGERVGRQMNKMQLQIGAPKQSNDDTLPLKLPEEKDWITGPLGPIDLSD
jgi:hypothetical protein